MKTKLHFKKSTLLLIMIALFIPGCVVISFYPLYEKDDLFNNDLLTGQWLDDDSTLYMFQHPTNKKDGQEFISDSAGYALKLKYNDSIVDASVFFVNLVNLDSTYFLDFYLSEYAPRGNTNDFYLYDLHVMPVHTFARLTHWGDSLLIEWLDPDWLKDKFKENKIRIRHEDNGENILLTAHPDEIKKFLIKYGHEKDAFEFDIKLHKN